MKEFKIQRKDKGIWEFESPSYICYISKEKAQRSIDKQIEQWRFQKTLVHPVYDKYDIEQYSKPENWRIVQREVTKWEPVTEGD